MEFEELGRRLKLAVVLCALGYGAWWLAMSSMNDAAEKAVAQSREGGDGVRILMEDGRDIRLPERVDAAQTLGFKDPAAGLEAMRAILASPRDADEKAVAKKRVSGLLVGAHRVAGDAKDWPRQAALWGELAAAGDDATIRRLIAGDRARWLSRAVGDGDDASADLLAAAMRVDAANDETDARRALTAWRDRQYEKWRAARAAKDARAEAAALGAMASWEPHRGDLSQQILSVCAPPELIALAKASIKTGSYGTALLLLQAAVQGRGDAARKAQPLLDDAAMGLAADPALASATRGSTPPAVELLLRVYGPRRPEALARAAALIEAWADSLPAVEAPARASLYDRAVDNLKESAALAKQPPPAAAARLAEKSVDARLEGTLARLSSGYEGAFEELRPLLRDGKDPARRERALGALRDAWKAARDKSDFDRLVDFSAYWISEAGVPPFSDPFHQELKTGLMALAESSKKEALNKRVFALSLLADAFPDDPEARDARREAAARGAELARATSNRGAPPSPFGASSLPGRTIALIENGTAHHILMLYEGPETFFVRINPYRRGTVVLKDGKYLIGVATIKDEIKPYAVSATFASALVHQKFVVVQRGRGGDSRDDGGYSYGYWTLLRAPDGEKPAVDPRDGRIRL